MSNINIFTDGGARGNPGPSACAFVAYIGNEKIHHESKYLSFATNNVAEYKGLILALTWLLTSNHYGLITIFMDSLLVVNQLNGLFKIKNPDLIKLHQTVKQIEKEINGKISYSHVPREKNKIADALVNEELDKNA